MRSNQHLDKLLDKAAEIQSVSIDYEQTSTAHGAMRYAVLKRVESQLKLPALVKYGDAPNVCEEHVPKDARRLWDRCNVDDHTLFYVEDKDWDGHDCELLDQQFLAIGGFYMGEVNLAVGGNHRLYLWPHDASILQQLPEPP